MAESDLSRTPTAYNPLRLYSDLYAMVFYNNSDPCIQLTRQCEAKKASAAMNELLAFSDAR